MTDNDYSSFTKIPSKYRTPKTLINNEFDAQVFEENLSQSMRETAMKTAKTFSFGDTHSNLKNNFTLEKVESYNNTYRNAAQPLNQMMIKIIPKNTTLLNKILDLFFSW